MTPDGALAGGGSLSRTASQSVKTAAAGKAASTLLTGEAKATGRSPATIADELAASTRAAEAALQKNLEDLLPNRDTVVYSFTGANKLPGEKRGLIYVRETPVGTEAAKALQAGTPGSFSDMASKNLPCLR